MAVYIGNSGGKKILGVTKASQDQWNVGAQDSIFHSSLPYLQVEEIRLTGWDWLVLGPQSLYAYTNYYIERGVSYPQIRGASTLNSSGGSTQPGNDSWNWNTYWYDSVQYQFQRFYLTEYAKALLRQRTPFFLVYVWSDGYRQMVQPRSALIPVDSNEGYFDFTPTSQSELMSVGQTEYTHQLNLTTSQDYMLVGERRPQYDRGAYGVPPARTLDGKLITEVYLYFTKNLTMDAWGNLSFVSLNTTETGEIKVDNTSIVIAGQDVTNNKYFAVHNNTLSFTDNQYTNDVQVSNLFQGDITQPQGEILKHHSFYGYSWYDEYNIGLPFNSTNRINTMPISTSRMFQYQPQYGCMPINCSGFPEHVSSQQKQVPIYPNKTSKIIFPTELGGRYLSLGVTFNSSTIYTRRDFLTDRKYTELSYSQRQPLVCILHGKSAGSGVSFSSRGGEQGIRVAGKSLFQENTKLFCKVGTTYRVRVPRSYFTPDGMTSGVAYQGVRKQYVQSLYLSQQEAQTNTFITAILPLVQTDYSLQIKQQGWRGHVWNYVQFQLQPFQIHRYSYNGTGFRPGWFKSSSLDQYTGGSMPVQVDDSQQVFTQRQQQGTQVPGSPAHLGVIDLPIGYSYILNWDMTNSFRTYKQQTPLTAIHVCKGTQGQHLVLERVSQTELQVFLIDYNYPDCYIEQPLGRGEGRQFYPGIQHSATIFNVQIQPLY